MTLRDLNGEQITTAMLSSRDAGTIKHAIRKRVPRVADIRIEDTEANCLITILVDIDGVAHRFEAVHDDLTPWLDREFYHIDLLNLIDRWIEDGKNLAAAQARGEVQFTKEHERYLTKVNTSTLEDFLATSPTGMF